MAKKQVKMSKRAAANLLREAKYELEWRNSLGLMTSDNIAKLRSLLTKLASNLDHGAPL